MAQQRPGADCSSNNECLIAKFRLKLTKVEKTTRPFRHDLSQISYDYTVEVMEWSKEDGKKMMNIILLKKYYFTCTSVSMYGYSHALYSQPNKTGS